MSDETTVETEADRQLKTLRDQHPDEDLAVLIAGDFQGVFRAPTPVVWKRLKAELRGEQTRLVADQNLVAGCLLWPSAEVMRAAANRKAALYDVLASSLADMAGAGQAAVIKK